MTALAPDDPAWSRARWMAVVLGVLAIHLSGILFLSRNARETPPQKTAAPVRTYWTDMPRAGLGELLAAKDPLIFFRLDERAFSRTNWTVTLPASVPATNEIEPVWMRPLDSYFADDFRDYVAEAVPGHAIETARVPPLFSEVALLPARLPARAVPRLEGGLAGRRLISPLPPPANEASAPLTNTVVSVVADGEGFARSAAILSGSGSPAADQSALEFARQARFVSEGQIRAAAGSTVPLLFGRLIFQWFPAPVVLTNVTATTTGGK